MPLAVPDAAELEPLTFEPPLDALELAELAHADASKRGAVQSKLVFGRMFPSSPMLQDRLVMHGHRLTAIGKFRAQGKFSIGRCLMGRSTAYILWRNGDMHASASAVEEWI
jgi:hypothetical protein